MSVKNFEKKLKGFMYDDKTYVGDNYFFTLDRKTSVLLPKLEKYKKLFYRLSR